MRNIEATTSSKRRMAQRYPKPHASRLTCKPPPMGDSPAPHLALRRCALQSWDPSQPAAQPAQTKPSSQLSPVPVVRDNPIRKRKRRPGMEARKRRQWRRQQLRASTIEAHPAFAELRARMIAMGHIVEPVYKPEDCLVLTIPDADDFSY